jgi:preprotein translocase subunit SecY
LVSLFIIILVVLVTYFVRVVERGQRKILVNYTFFTRQVGNKGGGQSSHLPLKLNMAGVMPIFASSIHLLPSTVVSWVVQVIPLAGYATLRRHCRQANSSINGVVRSSHHLFRFLLYRAGFNSHRETANNLKMARLSR